MNTLAEINSQIRDLYRTVFFKDETDSLKIRLTKGAVGSFALKIVSTGLSFTIGLLLARMLGANGYGIYSYVLALIGLLGIPSIMGLDRLLIRNVASYNTQSEWGLMQGLLRWANYIILILSLGIALPAFIITALFSGYFDSQILNAFWMALFLLPLTALIRYRQTVLQGLHRVVQGQFPEMIIQPFLFITFIYTAYLFAGKGISATTVVGMNVITMGVAFIVGIQLLHKNLPENVKDATAVYKKREWFHIALPLLFLSSVQIVNAKTDVVMLGAFKGTESVGIYSAASRGALLITFVLEAANAALAPAISSLYISGDIKRLQSVITKSARLMLFFALPLAFVLMIFGHWVLLLFGQEFTKGTVALAILSFGQLINVSMGSVGLLLVMTSHERYAAIGVAISALLNITLNVILIPKWDIEGAAIAKASSLIICNILMAIWVYRKLGIHSTALGKIHFSRD